MLDAGVLTEIRRYAGRFGRGLRAAGYEPEDVAQELAASCLQHFRRYDPMRSSTRTFIHVIGRSRVASIAEKACAQKRDFHLCQESLNTISIDTYQARLGRRSRSSEELLSLRIDTSRALARLTPELRTLARELMLEDTVGAAARKLGLSRATAYRRIGELRLKLQAAGLGRYVDSNPYRTEAAA